MICAPKEDGRVWRWKVKKGMEVDHFLNSTRMAVMLSRPYGSVGVVPGLIFLSKNCFRHSLLLNVRSSFTK